jgi:hypothetical protein
MRLILRPALLLALLFCPGEVLGQTGGGSPATKSSSTAGCDVQVRFVDGSRVRMAVLQDSIEVITKYGKLTVPVREIRKVEFGLHVSDEVAKQVDQAVQHLGSNVHGEREAASRQLVELGHRAYPAIQMALKSKDPEVARRAEEVVKKIREKVPAQLLRLDSNDRIETSEFPIVGRISSAALKARSTYFGEKEVKVDDLLAVRILHAGGSSEFALDAAKYGVTPQQWFDTGIEIDADMDLDISASGQVDLRQDGTGQFVTGPGGWHGGPGAPAPGRGGRQTGWAGGALVGRIGDNGETFLIGEQYRGKPTREGKLYVQIVPSPWGTPPAGTYNVKVKTGD